MARRLLSRLIPDLRLLNMPSNEGAPSTLVTPFKVLILGGSYGGLAAALHLLDLCKGRPSRFASEPIEGIRFGGFPVDITVVDERDGYCELNPVVPRQQARC
jgi:hypothetical protein